MLIQKNDPLCGKCLVDNNCDCLCHIEDIISGRHYEIHRENLDFKVKPVRDLDHFRHTGLKIWIEDKIYWFRVKFFRYDSD